MENILETASWTYAENRFYNGNELFVMKSVLKQGFKSVLKQGFLLFAPDSKCQLSSFRYILPFYQMAQE